MNVGITCLILSISSQRHAPRRTSGHDGRPSPESEGTEMWTESRQYRGTTGYGQSDRHPSLRQNP